MLRGRRGRRSLAAALGLMAFALAGADGAEASSPRWITGPPYFTTVQTPVIWYVDQPAYFTDSGDLSASVNHAAADAMVAAAASVWNVPSARIVLQQGGELAEHVSGANVYLGSNGLVFPPDVQSTNYASVQIAVIYDSDGSVTDLLLGGGASNPNGCRQNAVTESVDSITPAGFIQHAVLILNGLCTGPDPEQQLQMQYQLERAFGRVLGLGWSQLNDNVFTGTPQPTFAQNLNWPIMHPIDVICGLYTYQCLQQPFKLRDDDVASITMLYPVTAGNVAAGKQLSTTRSSTLDGVILFPSLEGMAGVNVVLRRNALPQQVTDTWDDVSAVSGFDFQQIVGNPITPKPTSMAGSLGALTPVTSRGYLQDPEGYFIFPWIPLPSGETGQDILMHTEAINPLYTGEYSIGPYPASTVTPSGSSTAWRFNDITPGWSRFFQEIAQNTATTCSTPGDGTQTSPAAVPQGGWWTDLICGSNSNRWSFAHSAWTSLPIQANRSLTIEVTALDETGTATANKLRPVMGVWHATDATGSTPSVAAVVTAFNSVSTGMTTLAAQSSQADTFRIAISDERGVGRPDFSYQARILYADSVAPAISGAGAQVTITGVGFRSGNTVTIDGIAAKVTSWTSTTIVATVPFLKAVPVGTTVAVDVVVTDLSTQGTTVMSGAFQYVYTAPVYTLLLVSGPSGSLPITLPATEPFVVKVLDVDGVKPLTGVPVVFSATVGSVVWEACGTVVCTVVTDANGQASAPVTPSTVGAVTLQAAALGLTQSVSFQAVPLVRAVTMDPPLEYLAEGAIVSWSTTASFFQQGLAATGEAVVWTVPGSMTLSATQVFTDSQGSVQTMVSAGPLASGEQVAGSACAWGGVCGSFAAQGVDSSQFVVVLEGGAGQSVPATGSLLPLTIKVTNGVGDPVAGAALRIHQTVSQWTAPCPAQGRCPVAPTYEALTTAGTSDSNGMMTLTPLQISGAEVTDIVVTSGTQGFVSLSLQKHP
ncbi:IPT/TIG domain-containing protein [Granulicella arctica]|uniref:IPT/TIG domain-containing protein n=1 Tax=Granulicella arctica TaxID=940613 RepID=A0A7Y9TFR5_9BACT|nr:IPT/TIG domain-containing protein [Granulicella arctica]NYF77920.1 hypothetical protein [Granulicella arctica]